VVRQRLEDAAMKLAADELGKLGIGAELPWARDLLTAIPALATSPTDLRRQRAEGALRIVMRAILAETSVRSRTISWGSIGLDPAANEGVWRHHVSGWVYWRLAQLSFLAGKPSAPDCGHAGNARVLCDHLGQLNEPDRIAEIDRLTGVGWMFDTFAVLQELAKQTKTSFTPKVMIEALLKYDDWGGAQLSVALSDLQAKLGALPDVATKWSSLLVWWDRVRKEIRNFSEGVTNSMRGVADVSAQVQAFTAAVDTKIGGASAKNLAAALGAASPMLQPFCSRLDDVIAFRTNWPGAALLDRLSMLDKLTAMIGLTLDAHLLMELDRAFKEVQSRITGIDLRHVKLDDLVTLVASLDTMSFQLQQVDEAFRKLAGVASPEIAAVLAATRRITAFSDVASQLVRALRVQDIATVLAHITGVATLVGQNVDMAMFERLAPLAELLRSGASPSPAQIYRLIVSVTPTSFATDLGLDLETDCKEATSWKCWSTRLALALQGAVKVEGSTVTIDTDVILADLSKYGADKRREETWKPYLHLAVGGGFLYGKSGTPPLVAEQIGVGVTMYRTHGLSVRAAAFGSGLLYRFVLDSKESNGVMVGGALLLGIEDLVELYAGAAVILEPSMDQSDGTARGTLMFGIQVPLSDYLSKL
jgi:hypothetical protein